MMQARHLLEKKGTQVFTVGPEDSVYQALEALARHDIGALAVVEGDRLVGMFSERDYARKVVLQGLTSRTTRVRALMSSDPVTAEPQTSIADCMRLMTEHRIRHLPILVAGQLSGLVSIGDLVKSLLAEQEELIGELRDYIGGKS
jgi:CBS domain-containing protein